MVRSLGVPIFRVKSGIQQQWSIIYVYSMVSSLLKEAQIFVGLSGLSWIFGEIVLSKSADPDQTAQRLHCLQFYLNNLNTSLVSEIDLFERYD